ncbi:DUF3055 domain-containing protein [Paenibacillus koleovorans]|uniref:DUF3055 domain-containing protein n=1 Tax=Paenibacillus koleovorans TaxID=121608 RepID=UPI000FD992A1|nr:DUF3055 domain-containing protein [Paenibacillus koleovorans]
MLERFYDLSEQAQVNFVGFATEKARYDFAIVYTNHFFGKPLVICMQTNHSSLLDADDLTNLTYLQQTFHLKLEEAMELSEFLYARMPILSARDQY